MCSKIVLAAIAHNVPAVYDVLPARILMQTSLRLRRQMRLNVLLYISYTVVFVFRFLRFVFTRLAASFAGNHKNFYFLVLNSKSAVIKSAYMGK
jgi:hypothetical protein